MGLAGWMTEPRGIALVSLEEKINTSSAAGELVFHMFGAIAHFERRLIAERTKDGIAAARAKRPAARPPAARHGSYCCRSEAGGGRIVANPSGPTAWARTLDGL